MSQSNTRSRSLRNRKKNRLAVFDLNRVIAVKSYKDEKIELWKSEKEIESFKIDNMTFYVHPDIRKFIRKIKKRYVVAIWSSTTKHYVERALDIIFPHWKEMFLFVWPRDFCIPHPDPINAWDTIKPLQLIFDKYSEWNANNTVIIDDDIRKVSMNKHYIIFNGCTDSFESLRNQLTEEFKEPLSNEFIDKFNGLNV